MAGLAYDKSKTTGHSNYPPTIVNATQSKVFVEGKAVLREGDRIVEHTKTVNPHDTHGGSAIASTNKIFVSGVKAVMMADRITCGDTIALSSSKVYIK